jgi:hypothetical protein
VARLARLAGVVVTLSISGALLASCGAGDATSDARRSCVYVKRAIALEARSQQPGLSASRRRGLQGTALSELLKGTSSAAAATSIDGSWNPLMTTINEAERVPLLDLEASLTRLCRIADSQTPYL